MREFDIVVVGSGPAGIMAAVTACHHNKRVALVEKADRLGGTGLGSAYGMWIPNNRHLRALGIEDPRDDCMKLMCRHSYPEAYDEQAEHHGIPAEDYRVLESYYEHASEMLELFEKETGIPSRPMLNHSRDFDCYDGTRELLEQRGVFKAPQMDRWMPDYHASDPNNRAPVGRYLTFGLTALSVVLYYVRIIRALGARTILRAVLQLLNPLIWVPLLRGAWGRHREGVFGYAGSGVRITRFIGRYFRERGVEVALRTRLRRVLWDEQGAVRGIEVEGPSGELQQYAAPHVVLATGGFNYNPELVQRYASKTPVVSSNGIPTCTGDALAALDGAQVKLAHMDQYWLTDSVLAAVARNPGYDPYGSHNVWYMNGDSFIVVDQHGRRCLDESRPYSLRAKYYRRPDRLLTILVFDERCYRRFGGLFRYLGTGIPYKTLLPGLAPSYLLRGRDPRELSGELERFLEGYRDVLDVRLDPDFSGNLAASIERYNGFARQGADPDFGRGSELGTAAWLVRRAADNHLPNKHMYPMDPAGGLYAIVLCCTCFSTKGGLAIDGQARVLRQDGTPLPGLYAAGNCSASPSNSGYVISTIGPAMTFGYLAARHAAAALEGKPAEPPA